MPLGVLAVLLVLLLNLLAASPTLHEQFHADAGSTQHQCAVTLFAHGQVDAPAVDVALPVSTAAIELLPQFSVSISNALVATLPPGRGPPVSCLHS